MIPVPEQPAREKTPCGLWMDWLDASWHVMTCDACDKTLKERKFIAEGDTLARRAMGIFE